MLIMSYLKEKYPSIYFRIKRKNDITFSSEVEEGPIEYKSNLDYKSGRKKIDLDYQANKFASQLKWRIAEAQKNDTKSAFYYIGVTDKGNISGLSDEQILAAIDFLIKATQIVSARISKIYVIENHDKKILKVVIKSPLFPDDHIFW